MENLELHLCKFRLSHLGYCVQFCHLRVVFVCPYLNI